MMVRLRAHREEKTPITSLNSGKILVPLARISYLSALHTHHEPQLGEDISASGADILLECSAMHLIQQQQQVG